MKTFYQVVGEAVGRSPAEWVERWSIWIIAVLGTVVLGILGYAWWTAYK